MGISTLTGVAAAVATTVAAATVWAGGGFEGSPQSQPDFVTPACEQQRHAAACDLALRYLAALDLDEGRAACALLARSTLERAGGIEGCVETVSAAQGIRIRYSLLEVNVAEVGSTVRFTTQGESDTPVTQSMFISPDGRIVAVLPAMG